MQGFKIIHKSQQFQKESLNEIACIFIHFSQSSIPQNKISLKDGYKFDYGSSVFKNNYLLMIFFSMSNHPVQRIHTLIEWPFKMMYETKNQEEDYYLCVVTLSYQRFQIKLFVFMRGTLGLKYDFTFILNLGCLKDQPFHLS